MAWRVVRWAPALVLGALWWWGVLRLALVPDAGVLEGAVAAGGWGLSLLPVHCVPYSRAVGASRAARSSRAAESSRVSRSSRPGECGRRSGGTAGWLGKRTAGGVARFAADAVTRAWRRRRSGGGSGLS
ncbi:hypothetical protein AB0I94_40455 [Streptomyces sp. NPDC050147]|uniref:hypothetical protein n=1 Tax=Streptomyces sp. NPDC050147 TaxID=3155513 RepID=UPI00343CD79B